MIRLVLILSFIGCAFCASAQVSISGCVRAVGSDEGVSDVNVMLQNEKHTVLYGYAISDADGNYSVSYSGDATTIEIVITGFNIKGQSKSILAQTQRVDFDVEYSALEIREVVVNAESVQRQSDTLSYNVSSFINVTDRSIGDVLRKMPGLSVAESGEVKYNGKPISKFYIEGLDMLRGSYGIATNNIRAEDIARVEVYENHEAIKSLRGVTMPTQAALNIRLKENVKGTWNGTLLLGGGYKPWMWNGEASVMFFGREFQTLNIFKTNNMGEDVSREFRSHYGGLGGVESMIGIHKPTTPNIGQSRYLENNILATSLNAISKLGSELTFSVNANYLHDMQHSKGSSITTYNLPNSTPITIREATTASHLVDRCDFTAQLESNADRYYLNERISFAGVWNRDNGVVDNDGEVISQYFKLPKTSVGNNLNIVRRWDRWIINFYSDINYDTQPAVLEVRPMMFEDIIEVDDEHPNAVQTLYGRRFVANNHMQTTYKMRRWSFMLTTQLNANVEWMESSLNAVADSGNTLPAPTTLRNDIFRSRYDIVATPSVQYSLGQKLVVQADVPLDLMWLRTSDRLEQTTIANKTKLICSPLLSLNSNITHNLKLSMRAGYSEFYGTLYDSYPGYIMTDYRVMQRKDGDISRTQYQNYTLSLSYGNAIDALFASVDAGYFVSRRNLMYNTNYYGSLSEIEAVDMPSRSNGYSASGNISKRFDVIGTTATLSGGWIQSWSQVLFDNVLLSSDCRMLNGELKLNTRFTRAVRLDYVAAYNRGVSYVDDERLSAIDVFKQRADLDLIIAEKVICRIGAEHYLNTSIEGSSRNTVFVDASVKLKTKRIEYSIEAHNILNNKVFANATNSDITGYVYSYELRPASIVFKVKFNFR